MTTYESMLAKYSQQGGGVVPPNAEQEICQKIALAGLCRGGFFDHAAFYGGTCLRLFHGLPRFSEDLDFSLIEKRDDIHLENYFDAIREEFKIAGFEVIINKKEKKMFGRVESAFLKENTEAYDIKFQTKKTVKVKIELDTDPPLLFNTEQKVLLDPYSFMTRCVTLPDLFAGKMHALVYRAWKRRVKGRDCLTSSGMCATRFLWISSIFKPESKNSMARMSVWMISRVCCGRNWPPQILKRSRRMLFITLTVRHFASWTSGPTTTSCSWQTI